MGKIGGGVGFYAKEFFIVKILSCSDVHFDNKPEFIIAQLSFNDTKILFSVIYRRPTAALPTLFFNQLEQYIPQFSTIVITGDLNINMNISSYSSNFIISHLDRLALKLVPSPPTHHVVSDLHHSHTWIDIFFTRDNENSSTLSKTDAPFIAGHDLIELKLDISKPSNQSRTFKSRKLTNINESDVNQLFTNFLSDSTVLNPIIDHSSLAILSSHNYSLPPLSSSISQLELPVNNSTLPNSIDLLQRTTTSAITRTFNILAPLKTISISSKCKPWVTPQTRILMRLRDQAYGKATNTSLSSDILRYKSLRSQVSNTLDTAKNNYIGSKLENASSPAAKWRFLKSLNVSNTPLPSPFSTFLPSTLNIHYASIVNQAPPLTTNDLDRLVHSSTLPSNNSFIFRPATISEISRIISHTNSKGYGYDEISAKMIKFATPAILPYLTNIVNHSLIYGFFPSDWKKALLSPLAKSKFLSTPSDTRPIAQLSELSKVLERVVHSQLSYYLESNSILHPRQSGFRRGYSTTTALACLVDDIKCAIDKRMITILVLFDFSKAFDTIPHVTLLEKLRNINVSNHVLKWFFSYLADRIQAVIDNNGKISDWLSAASGVPQGSVLGPLLFSIFINDLPNVILFTRILLFADDAQIYGHFLPSDIHVGIRVMSGEAQRVADWAKLNGLHLNDVKTKVMILGSDQYVRALMTSDLPSVRLNGLDLPYANEVTVLGLTISPTLTFNSHVNSLKKRVNSTLYVLRRYRNSISFSLRKQLVETLVFPILDYAAPVYDALDKSRIKCLQVSQNACVRFVYGNIPYASHVTPFRLKLQWLSAESRRQYLTGTLAYKVITKNRPAYLSVSFLQATDTVARRSARNPPAALLLPTYRTQALASTFFVRATRIINETHTTNFELTAIDQFKNLLRSHLFNIDKNAWHLRAMSEGLNP